MLNKRITAIAMSFLLAISPMYSSVYGMAAAPENNAILVDTTTPAVASTADTDEPKDNECSMAPIDEMYNGANNGAEDPIDGTGSSDNEGLINPLDGEGDDANDDANYGGAEDPIDTTGSSDNEGPFNPIDDEGGSGNEGTLVPIDDPDYSCAESGHKFGNWTVVVEPTTRVDGKKERKCSVCGETEAEVVAHTILKVKSITISRTSATLLNGRSVQLWAKPAPADATTTSVTWKSSDPKVATVSASGLVSAKRRGTTTITCTAKDGGGAKATCKITVNLGVAKIALDRTSLALNKGRTFTLKATVSPAAATNKAITWKSSNTSVATVTSAGKVTFKARGTATITCTAKDGSGVSASCKVTVRIPVSVINLGRSSATLTTGKTLTLRAGVGPASANNKTVSWKSSNTSVATVSSDGTITAVGKGTAVITCSARDGSGVKATCKITVNAPVTAKISGASSGSSSSSSSSGSSSSSSSSSSGSGSSSGSSGSSGSGSGSSSSGSGSYSGGSSGGSGGGYVWISQTGSKYHKINNCGTMNPNKATKVTVEEAERKGLDPCKNCF